MRPAVAGAPAVAHSLIRTLAGQARRTGTRREVELDMPRGREQEPLGVHIRAVALDDGHVTIEALDVTDAHRLNRMRRDFVANVSHELKTPVGALQLLAEALQEAIEDDGTGLRPGAPRSGSPSASGTSPTGSAAWSPSSWSCPGCRAASRCRRPDPVMVDRVVAEVLDRTRTTAAAKGIEVQWTGKRGLTAFGSESQLVTALANLVENAIAYTPGAPRRRRQPAEVQGGHAR